MHCPARANIRYSTKMPTMFTLVTTPCRKRQKTRSSQLKVCIGCRITLMALWHNVQRTLAILQFVPLLRPYFDEPHFTVRTDQISMWWIFDTVDNIEGLASSQLILFQSKFEVVHRAGVKDLLVDTLSRPPTTGADRQISEDIFPL